MIIMTLSNKTGLLMESLIQFYNDTKTDYKYIREIKYIIESKSIISLRLLDWFVTNYSKKYSVIINDTFDVYQNYKLQLKSYSKKQFDPFCRKEKLIFYYNDEEEECIETSCGQLCFFRWCFENNILEYVNNNLKHIESDMKKSLVKTNANGGSVKKRQPLSLSASRSISRRNIKYNVSFN